MSFPMSGVASFDFNLVIICVVMFGLYVEGLRGKFISENFDGSVADLYGKPNTPEDHTALENLNDIAVFLLGTCNGAAEYGAQEAIEVILNEMNDFDLPVNINLYYFDC